MAILVSPGVLTREIDLSLYVPALSSSVLAMTGTATKGPVNKWQLITTVGQLHKTFGPPSASHPAILTAHLYFQQGRQLKFVRVGNPADLLTSSVQIPTSAAGAAVVQGANSETFAIAAATAPIKTGTEAAPYTITAPTAAVATGSQNETFDIHDATSGSVTGTQDQNFNIHNATAAQVVSSNSETYNIQAGVNDQLQLTIDGVGSTVTLTAGATQSAANIASDINAVFPGRASGAGGVVTITSPTTGSTSEITIGAPANNANATLGFTAATVNGLDNNRSLTIKIDGGANIVVTLTTGAARTAAQIVADINTAAGSTIAFVEGGTKVRITSPTTGTSSTVQLVAVSNSAYTTLGFTANTYAGLNGTRALSITIDGGAPQNFTLTAGGARTAAQIVSDLAGLTGATASVFGGTKVRITTSSLNGLSSTIVFGNPANNANTVLGFAGSYAGTAGNNKFAIQVDGGGTQTVTFTTGVNRTAQQIVDELNAGTTGLTASIYSNLGSSFIRITGNATGSGGSLNVMSQADNAYATLGFSTGSTLGTDGTDLLIISVDAGSDQNITLTAGINRTAAQIVADINASLNGAVASLYQSSRIQIATSLTGSTHTIQVKSASTADTVLGFDNSVHSGTNAGANSFEVLASSPGTWGDNLQIKIAEGTLAGTKTLQVLERGVLVETWKNLSKTTTDSNFYETAINGKSEYITIANNAGAPAQPTNDIYTMDGGSDGLSGLTAGHFIGFDNGITKTGMQIFRDPETFDTNLLACPGRDDMAIHSEMLSICEFRSDAMCVIDPPQGLTPQEVVDFLKGQNAYVARVTLNSSYGAMYYPWVQVYDSFNNVEVYLPPSASALRSIALTDVVADPWFAPAGLNRGRITEAIGIERSLTHGERDFLYENRVNPIADFVNDGVVIWGQKTLQALPTALDRVNVRRLMLYLRKIIATAARGLIFEPNTPRLWRRFINLVTPTLRDIQSREGIVDYRVVCDATVNTPAVLDRNEFRALIYVKPVKAAEFLIIDFVLVAQGSTFDEKVI